MDRINADGGFLPGIFGRLQKKASRPGSAPKLEPKPHHFWKKLPHGVRNNFLAMSGEFVGTFMFLFLAFAGTQIANTSTNANTQSSDGPNTSVLLYIALCFGFSLAVNAWIFFRVTGGLFNPAVTLGLCLIGAVPFGRGCLVFIAQMLGGMASAGVVSALFPGPLLVNTTLAAGTSKAQGTFIEMFLTAQLVFTIFMLAAEKHKSTFLAPVGIGLSLFVAELAGVYYTGGSLNPARSFGPCVALRSFPTEHWIYWVGPILGALVASGFFWFIKSCEYETVNPGQDFDDLEAEAFNPEAGISRPIVAPTVNAEDLPSRQNTGDMDYRMNELMEGKQPYPEKPRGESRGVSHTYTIQSPNGHVNHNGQYQPQHQPQYQPPTDRVSNERRHTNDRNRHDSQRHSNNRRSQEGTNYSTRPTYPNEPHYTQGQGYTTQQPRRY